MEEKSLRLVMEGEDAAKVEGDELFLRQALVNVMHNAVKYSPAGASIEVRVAQTSVVRGQWTVTIDIEDHGPGIPAEDHARVFDRFYRVDKARSRESGGAGLGLSIVKWAVEAHGGSIDLMSEPGQGCTIRISLPAAYV
jgi:signal transduction histidine kinase